MLFNIEYVITINMKIPFTHFADPRITSFRENVIFNRFEQYAHKQWLHKILLFIKVQLRS